MPSLSVKWHALKDKAAVDHQPAMDIVKRGACLVSCGDTAQEDFSSPRAVRSPTCD
jgi:hypothetical protein